MAGNNLGVAQGSIQVDTSGLRDADLALRSAGTSMINFGQQAIGAFAAIVGTAAQFEKEMTFVQAVTNATETEMGQLEAAAIDLAKNGIYGPVALSEAFVELAKAGASVQDIIDGVGEASVQLATAADVEIAFAGENLINTLNTFNLEATEAGRVADILAGAANASSISLDDLFLTFKYAGPVAASMGVDIENLSEAISLLGLRGIRGSTAGTSLRQILLNLDPATEKATNRMKELGIVTEDGTNLFFDASGKAKNLGEVFQILNDKMKDMTQQQRVEAMRDLFGVRPLPSALILMEQAAAGFDSMNEAIGRTTAADVAAKRMDTLDGAIQQLKATIEAAFVEGGNPLLDGLKEIVQFITEAIRLFTELPGPVKTFIVAAIGVVGVLSLMAGAFLLTIGNIVRAVRVIGEIGNAFRLFSGAARAATAANAAMSASFLLNPFFLLAAAIVAIIAGLVLLYFHFKPFREFIDNLWQDIQKLWDTITEGVVDAWHAVQEFFGNIDDEVKKAFGKAWDRITEVVGTVAENVEKAARAVVDFVKEIPGEVGKFLSELPGVIAEWIGKAVSTFATMLSKLPYWAGFVIGFVIGRFIRFGLDLIQLIVNTFNTVQNTLISWGTQAVSWAIDTGAKILNGILDFLIQLPGRILDLLTEVITTLLTWGPQFVSGGIDIAMNFLNGMVSFLMQLPGRVWSFLTSALSTAVSFIGQFFSTAWDIGTAIIDGIINVITGLPGLVWDILQDVIGTFKNLVTSAFNAAKDFAGGLWDGFKSGLGINSPSYIEEALYAIDDQIGATEGHLGRAIKSMQGLSAGIPPINSGAIGIQSPTQAAGGGMTIAGPLLAVDKLEGTQEEALSISRRLADETYRQMAAKGKRVILSGT